jgi:hypothetical protein
VSDAAGESDVSSRGREAADEANASSGDQRPIGLPTGRCVFVPNLDAELELAAPQSFRRSPGMSGGIAARLRALAPSIRIVLPRVRIVGLDRVVRSETRETPGLAWCPTPHACADLARFGARLPRGLDVGLAVLQEVNHRRFVVDHDLAAPLPGARFTIDADEAIDLLGTPPPSETGARRWLAKRAFGFAGRLRKRFEPAPRTMAERTWVAASMTGEYGVGLQIEPEVERVLDVAVHGWVDPVGGPGDPSSVRVHVFAIRRSHCDADGRWMVSEDVDAKDLDEKLGGVARNLRATARRAGEALAARGYAGPFGIDAFVWRDGSGCLHLQACSDLNARFTMDWWAGFTSGSVRDGV